MLGGVSVLYLTVQEEYSVSLSLLNLRIRLVMEDLR